MPCLYVCYLFSAERFVQCQSSTNVNAVCSPLREAAPVLPSANYRAVRRTAHHILQAGDTYTEKERNGCFSDCLKDRLRPLPVPSGMTLHLLSARVSSKREITSWWTCSLIPALAPFAKTFIVSTSTNYLCISFFYLPTYCISARFLSHENTCSVKFTLMSTRCLISDDKTFPDFRPDFGKGTSTCIALMNTIPGTFP